MSSIPAGTSPSADFTPKNNPGFILHGPLNVTYEELPIPEVGPDEVLIEIKKTGICGSDVHFYNHGKMGLIPVTSSMCLGHESSGILVKLGSNVSAQATAADKAAIALSESSGQSVEEARKVVGKGALRLGEKVTVEPGVTCRMCVDCKSGNYQICEHMAFAATPPVHGTLQRYYKLPYDLVYPLPDSVDLVYGAMMEPLSVAIHSVSNVGGMRSGWNVLIMGAGPVGLLCMAVAKALGANRIVAVDINEERLKFAKGYAATDIYIPTKSNPDEPRSIYTVRAAAHLLSSLSIPPRGPGSIDLCIDATGAEVCIQMGINAVRPGGTYVQTGFGPPDVTIPMFRMVTNEVRIRGSWRYGCGDYPLAIDLVARGLVNLKPLLTHTFRFQDALEAFEITKNGKDKDGKPVIKCVIDGPE